MGFWVVSCWMTHIGNGFKFNLESKVIVCHVASVCLLCPPQHTEIDVKVIRCFSKPFRKTYFSNVKTTIEKNVHSDDTFNKAEELRRLWCADRNSLVAIITANILPPLHYELTCQRFLSYSLDVFNPVITHSKKWSKFVKLYNNGGRLPFR